MAFEKSFYSSSKRGSNSRVFLANTFLHTWLCMLNNIVDIVNVVRDVVRTCSYVFGFVHCVGFCFPFVGPCKKPRCETENRAKHQDRKKKMVFTRVGVSL